MRIESITLQRFRNVSDTTLKPHPRLNFLLGMNGQGKTSFLEAIGYLATLRSFRGSKNAEVIQWGQTSAEIRCGIVPETGSDWKTELKLHFFSEDRKKTTKTAFVNGKAFKSSTQYLSQRFGNYELGFHAVVFNPSDHDLVRNEPSVRRSYLDRVIAAEDIDYLEILQKYQKLLVQRNALLKSAERPQPELLLGFTEPLAHYAARLTLKRLEWVQKLAGILDETVHHIAPKQPILRLIYLSNWVPEISNLSLLNNELGSVHFSGLGTLPSLELLEQAFWKKQSSLEAAEWKSGHSLVGPHRDDWTFFLSDANGSNGNILKGHGSQGEVRSALLALKLCEIELFRNATGHRPIFLLDDFSSELDQERRSFLLNFLSERDLQVFVTTTDDSFLASMSVKDLGQPRCQKFWLRDGVLKDG